MPIAAFPGIGATIRSDCARIASARSSASEETRPTFTPRPGSSSKRVTTGPTVLFVICAPTRNVSSVFTSRAPDRALHAVRQKPGEEADQALSVSPVNVIGRKRRTDGDRDPVRDQEYQSGAEDRGPTPGERAQSLEGGERPAQPENRQDYDAQ